jgi:hypothetical protein
MMLKLVGFDYVIGRPDCPYLATKTEKLHYFQTTPGLDPSLFPARLYRAKHAFEDHGDICGQVSDLPLWRAVCRFLWSRFASSTVASPSLRASTRIYSNAET